MTKSYYECHITLLGDPVVLEPLVRDLKWKFSCINGDPVMGDGVKCYATMLFNNRMGDDLVLQTLLDAADYLEKVGCEVIRRKVERVIYDDRSDKVNFKCTGGCAECHLDDLCKSKEPERPTDRIDHEGRVIYPDLDFDTALDKGYDIRTLSDCDGVSTRWYGRSYEDHFRPLGRIKP